MAPLETPASRHALTLAIAISLFLHGSALLIPLRNPATDEPPAKPLQARLAPRVPTPQPDPEPVALTPPAHAPVAKPRPGPRLLTAKKSKGPAVPAPTPNWSVAQKAEMDKFLDDLAGEAKARPSLAQRSRSLAREEGRRLGRQDEESVATLERLPGSPPVDPFSLEMYLDALVKKLNRSAAFVRNTPRARGVRSAAVQIRLNPNGSLKSFEILNAADQQDEIAFIKSVVEQAVPFAAFPADMRQSARSLSMIICIRPTNSGGGGFGFTRYPAGQGC